MFCDTSYRKYFTTKPIVDIFKKRGGVIVHGAQTITPPHIRHQISNQRSVIWH